MPCIRQWQGPGTQALSQVARYEQGELPPPAPPLLLLPQTTPETSTLVQALWC